MRSLTRSTEAKGRVIIATGADPKIYILDPSLRCQASYIRLLGGKLLMRSRLADEIAY
jgi:hypothetical protein